MLKSKLSTIKYPCITEFTEIFTWLRFAPGVDPYKIDPVFLGRAAALCKHLGVIGYVTSGTRSYERQVELYIADGGFQLPNGEWTGGSGYVAKPGKSYHNYGLAIDIGTAALKLIDKVASFSKQLMLAKFGLCKPMTSGNGSTVLEDWHFQPIETINLTLDQRRALVPTGLFPEKVPTPPFTILRKGDEGENVKLLQIKLSKKGFKVSPDGDFGAKTDTAVRAFQSKNGAVADGIVGKLTWTLLN